MDDETFTPTDIERKEYRLVGNNIEKVYFYADGTEYVLWSINHSNLKRMSIRDFALTQIAAEVGRISKRLDKRQQSASVEVDPSSTSTNIKLNVTLPVADFIMMDFEV